MSKESKVRAAVVDAGRERYGKVYRKEIFHITGCPKCRAQRDQFKPQWCPGSELGMGSTGTCKVKGEHLHIGCMGCGFTWIEQVRDASDIGAQASPVDGKHPGYDEM